MRKAVFEAKRLTVLRKSQSFYKQLKLDERLSPETLDRVSSARAIAQAQFAMKHTRFYDDLYRAAGFSLKDLDDPAVFSQLPIVEKEDVRKHFDEIRSSESSRANSKVSTSGGSTGEPLRILRDLRSPTRAIEWRLFDWWGVAPHQDVAIVFRQVRSRSQELRHTLEWWPSKRMQLDAYRIDENSVRDFLTKWAKVKPSLLIGYVGGVVELGRAIQSAHLSIDSPRAVAVTAAPLNAAQREEISVAFGAPVFDHYRSAEIPWMAGECRERNGLHVFADVRRLEIVGDSGKVVQPGVTGQVVATDFTNRVFPLVRYRLGDRTSSIAGLCDCGITLPRIAPVAGRVSEAIRLPDGQVVAGESLTQTFASAVEAVRQFQVHQLSDYSIVVRCVETNHPGARGAIDRVIVRVQDIVGRQVPVLLEIVDSIPHDGGKIRYIKSDVPSISRKAS